MDAAGARTDRIVERNESADLGVKEFAALRSDEAGGAVGVANTERAEVIAGVDTVED